MMIIWNVNLSVRKSCNNFGDLVKNDVSYAVRMLDVNHCRLILPIGAHVTCAVNWSWPYKYGPYIATYKSNKSGNLL